ncbi:MAG: MgtC/SapB family protein [Liquorilactobacillus nagelii]|jgi:putative Mg2+ transporter-C (MgtC) family protein|uniref:Methyltransferase n=1 Tax=Liquorilactobacillus nagelii TaxID=82688 RepID=A0A3Q8CZE2_9LACO|nr:MgtC/SapB family protein [Liquorilactobacillus nagelii]AUJ32138.1 methyltransferase [Liquorilactobacillus nagelii]MCC7615302.1 methyltransferase [Liquorilactobacillus nagelii]MCP9315449.1 MgtC/SapB family protein [Liquorilactobacillus nagelii]
MYVLINFDWLLRLFLAAICGGLIGYERSRQRKSAGIRTHMVVAIASALIMIISKYGFTDVLNNKNIILDPSRIAAQIISGISFIGAGTILVRKDQVSGLTTAAGVWATAAIGMTEGAGQYFIGVAATILLVIIQFVFHDDSFLNKIIKSEHIRLQIAISNQPQALENVEYCLKKLGAKNLTLHIVGIDDNRLEISVNFVLKSRSEKATLIMSLQKNQLVLKINNLDTRL